MSYYWLQNPKLEGGIGNTFSKGDHIFSYFVWITQAPDTFFPSSFLTFIYLLFYLSIYLFIIIIIYYYLFIIIISYYLLLFIYYYYYYYISHPRGWGILVQQAS